MHLKGLDTDTINTCAFSPDGATLANGIPSSDKTVSLVDAASGKRRVHLKGLHADKIFCCAFSPDGATLARVSRESTASLLSK